MLAKVVAHPKPHLGFQYMSTLSLTIYINGIIILTHSWVFLNYEWNESMVIRKKKYWDNFSC